MCATYGRLYIYTMTQINNPNDSSTDFCPVGWRLPLTADWDTLINYVERDPRVGKGNAGRALKARVLWNTQDTSLLGWDLFGFRGLPAGVHYSSGASNDIGNRTEWWSNGINYGAGGTTIGSEVHILTNSSNAISIYNEGYYHGAYSVRCIRK